MTQTKANTVDQTTADEPEPTASEIRQWQREGLFVSPEDATADQYPRMTNMSAGFMFDAVIRPHTPDPADYVAIRMNHRSLEMAGAVGRWNMAWESAQFRRRHFDSENELPGKLGQLADLGDRNIIVVPRTSSRYFEYAPLIHLLPKTTLERFGLPLVRAGQWPFLADWANADRHLPAGFADQLSKAWAWQVWPLLNSGSGLSAFSRNEPLRLLAHNLDFWLPAVTSTIEQLLGDFPEVDKGVEPQPAVLQDGSILEATVCNPRMGGDLWRGEEDAADILQMAVEEADSAGRLRGILDAVKSNRVEDDFSDRWSFAREDFERKLRNKRVKVKVRFVEMTDTIPIQGPDTDVYGRLVTSDFMALLDPKERQIVFLLNSGWTRQQDIASVLGYSNHSAISKRLNKIRKIAEVYFTD
ncbi:sigma-70 family RNA polymerase sigma factor [Rhodococcus sp. 06-156-3C]|nr:sigma-70 family RNA polymerase sigma factor [Rhodococcus sp. 06-156-4C]OZD18743.1 sigma-70 family RNA polymerase sigma factor [Rhodococcus sp. 06-156-3C]OZD22253.1 sigma-70 family RNA polymerase sigma factor [Rhodococcus sp. 06-156-4a]OZD34059.1 sigma-70 family RNA polymerase sigma factor [Rhodococcus sp. 06-156-3b]OZD38796.1 sigma-70 family RNA polymerase sigma factor [Rhodococcus sp. 06-156-3]OZF57256.1 sigma-70 family RNA polymerase sigma factor [Rhodococcus sp. 06-156-4]